MMSSLRKNTATVLWILVFAFIATIIFSWGMGGFKGRIEPGIVAKVNGQKITRDEYDQALQNRFAVERQQGNTTELSESQTAQIREEVWQSLINEILLSEARKEAGIQVTDKELALAVQSMPPQSIIQNPQFRDSTGAFNWGLYRQILGDPSYVNAVIQIEQEVKAELLRQKLLRRIGSLDFVSNDEAHAAWERENTKATATYLLIPAQDMSVDSSLISDDQLLADYNERKDEFKVDENAAIVYVEFLDQPSRQDSLDASSFVENLMTRVRNGESFATLAKDFSEDLASGEKGGDLGWFKKSQMVAPFAEAAFSAKPGEMVGPIATSFGYHAILVHDRRGSGDNAEVHASHILIKVERSNETLEDLRNRADGFIEEARDTDFAEAAELYNLTVDTLDRLPRSGFDPVLGNNRAAKEFLFNRPKGEISPVYRNRQGLVVFKSTELRKSGFRPFDEVKQVLMHDALREQQMEKAAVIAQDIYDKTMDSRDFAATAREHAYELTAITRPFAVDAFVAGVGRDYAFTATTFNLNEREISKPVRGNRGYYIIRLDAINRAAESLWEQDKAEKLGQMLDTRQQVVLNAWVEEQRAKADIKDFRYLYYTEY